MEQLNAKLDAYLRDPKDSLDLSEMTIDAKGTERVAAFLRKW
jgi:hypothetical protein